MVNFKMLVFFLVASVNFVVAYEGIQCGSPPGSFIFIFE